MLADRYGLGVSTTSADALDAYVQGCDLVLDPYPGAAAAFDRAIAADPGFALAHAGKALWLTGEWQSRVLRRSAWRRRGRSLGVSGAGGQPHRVL